MLSFAEIKQHLQCAKLISCVMARGHAEAVVQALHNQKHVLGIDYATGRNQHVQMGQRDWQEVDMITAIVAPEYAEEVFYEMYFLAKIAEFEGGIIFQADLGFSTNYELPDLTEMVAEEVSLEKDLPK
ncbi:hypothetical protein [Thiosulfativibrio zosterae]|uniref:Nitrogen regulatory protein P-II n=1 Tax=Thiosulfativibrio zosterae TaxID=2675053 RepID=A0A6F8PQG4_9GAMM|nr:hypothetical protein [Thiosulfativibrio zosterae]BBP44361.1 hypothetical protein THMIRHAT_21070 [Thiosulfativibrio zosterae]